MKPIAGFIREGSGQENVKTCFFSGNWIETYNLKICSAMVLKEWSVFRFRSKKDPGLKNKADERSLFIG